MQELTFDQVIDVSGGVSGGLVGGILGELYTGIFEAQTIQADGCVSVPGHSLSPGAQALLAGIAGVASRLHITVAVGVAALASYFNAYVQQDQVTCPSGFSQEELTEMINRGLMSGGPL